MTKQNFATLTEEDLQTMFNMVENLENLYHDIAKCTAITDIFSVSLESFCKSGLIFDNEVLFNAVEIIHNYSYSANENITRIYRQFRQLYDKKIQPALDSKACE